MAKPLKWGKPEKKEGASIFHSDFVGVQPGAILQQCEPILLCFQGRFWNPYQAQANLKAEEKNDIVSKRQLPLGRY